MPDSSRMKTYQMRALVACAQHKSMRAAADELALSHSALTKAVRELELELGVPLIVRSSRGITLTPYGELTCSRARKILEDMRRMHDEIEQFKGGPHGRIVLAASSSIAFCVVPLAYSRFRQQMPQVDLEVMELSTGNVLSQLTEGRVDFAATHFEIGNLPVECEFTRLCSGSMAAVVRPGHPARHARRLQELLDYEWIYPSQLVARSEFERIFGNVCLEAPKRLIRSQSVTLNARLVGESDAIALLTRPFANHPWHQPYLAPLDLDDPLPITSPGTVVLRGTHLPPATQLLRSEIHKAILEQTWDHPGKQPGVNVRT